MTCRYIVPILFSIDCKHFVIQVFCTLLERREWDHLFIIDTLYLYYCACVCMDDYDDLNEDYGKQQKIG